MTAPTTSATISTSSAPVASASASAVAATDAGALLLPGESGTPLEGLSSWTDPAIVKRLEISCTFDPSKLSPDDQKVLFGEATGNAWGFSCDGNAFDQSCVYDPCFEAKDTQSCKDGCLGTCRTCEDTCTTSCTSCKAQCKDDACKKACAPTCGKCKQDCLTAQDRCRTGTCGQLYTACRKKLTADWNAKGCAAGCKVFEPCRDKCYEDTSTPSFDVTACLKQCTTKAKTTCDMSLCGTVGND
ncbi:MAG TPA: hypothetical protein VF407_10025 [Polyangiaceae bacterium]